MHLLEKLLVRRPVLLLAEQHEDGPGARADGAEREEREEREERAGDDAGGHHCNWGHNDHEIVGVSGG